MIGRSERIRTSDPLVPNEVRYQAAPHSDLISSAVILVPLGCRKPVPFCKS